MITSLKLLLPPPRWRPLLAFTALALVPGLGPEDGSRTTHLLMFLSCGLGLMPLAVALSHLVEQLVTNLGPRLGALISVVLGNLVELLVAFNALNSGLYPLVVTSIAGSVVINCLPVLGAGIVIACRGQQSASINPTSREIQSQQLLMSAILLALPSIFYQAPMSNALQGNESADAFSLYSALVAVIALTYYLLAFPLHQSAPDRVFEPESKPALALAASQPDGVAHPLRTVIPALVLVTVLVAIVSDRLVDTLEQLVQGAHVSELFVGLFLLPLFGCLPEMLLTIRAASRREIPLMLANTIDSSLQLLLLVLPLLVLAGLPLNRHLHLGLTPVTLAALAIAMVMIERITQNRELNSYEGWGLILMFVAMTLGALLLISP